MSGSTVNITNAHYGLCTLSLDGETILANGKAIGVTKEHYNSLLEEHEEYYNILIENNLIEPELTEEQIFQQMQDKLEKAELALEKSNAMQEQSNSLISELIERLDRLEKGGADVSKQITNDE